MRKLALSVVAGLVLAAAGCGSSSPAEQAQQKVAKAAEQRQPYIPQNTVEFNNYNGAQRLYDDPSTIIWCTAFPQANTSPVITVPIAGKLTSSSTTAFPPQYVDKSDQGTGVLSSRSVDGLFHPNPPPYRYGFTPGGQYVDFTELPTFCTTKPLEFQRQSVSVKVAGNLASADAKAQEALKAGDKAKAESILQAAAGQ